MRKSSRSGMVNSVWLPGSQDGVQDVDASAGQSDEGLVMPFSFGAFAVVEGAAGRVSLQGAERGLVEDPFEGFVAAGSAAQVVHFAGLLEYGGQTCGGGELVAGGEPVDAACHGEELGGQGGPHPGQGSDEGRVRVVIDDLGDAVVQLGEPTSTPTATAMTIPSPFPSVGVLFPPSTPYTAIDRRAQSAVRKSRRDRRPSLLRHGRQQA